ncbi:MAG: phosphotransferase [Deltaproteobacteria bacterium]|nr:phosphotransferase [Deltaproteobacteria bacterium]
MTERDIVHDLSDDLQSLIRTLNGELVEARPLSSAGYAGYCPNAVRLRFADGRVVKPDRNPFERRDQIDEWHRRCERDLTELAAAQVLDAGEARHAFDVAIRHAPPSRGRVGFVHRDFCAENLVLRPSWEVCIVDNETMGIDACDFDLGRTWYRWPMTRELREAFLAGYNRHRSSEEFVSHGAYWAIVALADAAVFRLRKHTGATEAPVARLRTLLCEFDRAPATAALLSC